MTAPRGAAAPAPRIGTAAGADVLVAGVFADDVDDPAAPHAPLAGLTGFRAEVGQVLPLRTDGGMATLVVGLGSRADLDAEALRTAAEATGRQVRSDAEVAVDLAAVGALLLPAGDAVRAVVDGLLCGSYAFTAHRSAPAPTWRPHYVLTGVDEDRAGDVMHGCLAAEGVSIARDLVNEPPGHLSPAVLAARAQALAEREGLEVRVLAAEELVDEGMGGLLAIGQGSAAPPRMVVLRHRPPGARRHLALVGKGITFDSGGLSLKPADGMATMKLDMAGAAAVIGAMAVVARAMRSGEPVALSAYLPLAENMPGPSAVRPGDVITVRDGTTVEILNTDFEGRVVLADALAMASEDAPDLIVDLATLTDACTVALGPDIAGLLGNGAAAVDAVAAAAGAAGEPVWRLPLARRYRHRLRSPVADTANFPGNRTGRAITAALFLEQFVPAAIPWAHIDMVGPAWREEAEGPAATGFGVRTLLRLVEALGAGVTQHREGEPDRVLR